MISVEGIDLPYKALTNFELEDAIQQLGIPYWRGIFMRKTLPQSYHKNECGILHLDDTTGSGSGLHGSRKEIQNIILIVMESNLQ